jgi:hypothetical protein
MRFEKRAAQRIAVHLSVLAISGKEQGDGKLVDVSLSGALIESSEIRPRLGAPVKITIPGAQQDSPPREFLGTVARHAAGGFAIRFGKLSRSVIQLVEEGK